MRTIRAKGFVHTGMLSVIALAMAAPSHAAIARRATLEELVGHATNVVIGRCVDVEARWNDEHSQILTHARYDVADDLLGGLHGSVEVTALGGEVGDIGMFVGGMPSFTPGADEVLFLVPGADATYDVVGMAQGQFRISFATPSSSPVVVRPLVGLELVGGDDERLNVGSLSAFVRAVRAAATPRTTVE